MGTLVVTEFISLDGVMEDPGGSEQTPIGGWTFRFERGPDGDAFKLAELMAADAQLLGGTTYRGFAAAWPTVDAGDFSEKMNTMPKYVVSSTATGEEWENSTVLRGDLGTEVQALKERYDGDILVAGSAQLVQALLERDLVDQLNLMVFPVVLGQGKRLFADTGTLRRFQLTDVRRSADVTLLTMTRPAEND